MSIEILRKCNLCGHSDDKMLIYIGGGTSNKRNFISVRSKMPVTYIDEIAHICNNCVAAAYLIHLEASGTSGLIPAGTSE